MKIPFAIYADTESLLEKTDACHNDPSRKVINNESK